MNILRKDVKRTETILAACALILLLVVVSVLDTVLPSYHIAIKVIGACIAFIPFFIVRELTDIPILSQSINPVTIAAIHSVYNVAVVLILLPFNQLIVKLVKKIVRGKKGEVEADAPLVPIDDRLFNSPGIVVNLCKESTIEMAHLAYDSFVTSLSAFEEYSDEKMEQINHDEQKLDRLEDELDSILVRLSAKDMSDSLNNEVNEILYCIREFERIGDYGVNMVNNAKNMIERNVEFSETANAEIKVLNSAIRQILEMTVKCFEKNDIALAAKVEPLEQVIDDLKETIKNRHIDRLRYGDCRGDRRPARRASRDPVHWRRTCGEACRADAQAERARSKACRTDAQADRACGEACRTDAQACGLDG